MHARGYAAHAANDKLVPFTFERPQPGPRDVVIDVLYCGVCHSDLHMVSNDLGIGVFPMVPGHEIVGRVSQVGREVTKLAVGDIGAVGALAGSCRTCPYCARGLEQYCDTFPTFSFSSYARGATDVTQGGFSNRYIVDEHFALKIPAVLDPAAAAPLLCGGIATYSPLRHWTVGAGTRVGIVGLGGLGHLATKFARAFGAHVVVLTTSARKTADAQALGADEAVIVTDAEGMKKLGSSLDFILDTVSGDHNVQALLSLLRVDGTLCMLGASTTPLSIRANMLSGRRRSIAGSVMGGIAETQEMLDFCAAKAIVANIEMLPISQVNDAFERLKRNDVRYRFVLDMAELHPEG
jgi:uncharacterized zinc-type alcohol dehydrogenase-like protein